MNPTTINALPFEVLQTVLGCLEFKERCVLTSVA